MAMSISYSISYKVKSVILGKDLRFIFLIHLIGNAVDYRIVSYVEDIR
jgi:hypothetical protein